MRSSRIARVRSAAFGLGLVVNSASAEPAAVPPCSADGCVGAVSEADARVCYPPAAEPIAARLAAALPSAIARVEAAQGRPFPAGVEVSVCGDLRSFARFSPTLRAAAVMTGTGIVFSPRIAERPHRLSALLIHELSHLHLVHHLGIANARRLPVWFREGLAVHVSGGGGAERVSEQAAEQAVLEGRCGLAHDRQDLELPWGANEYGATPHLFYRQAGMFVAFLAGRDRVAYRRLLDGLLDGRPFEPLFMAAYGGTPTGLFRAFADEIAAGAAD